MHSVEKMADHVAGSLVMKVLSKVRKKYIQTIESLQFSSCIKRRNIQKVRCEIAVSSSYYAFR